MIKIKKIIVASNMTTNIFKLILPIHSIIHLIIKIGADIVVPDTAVILLKALGVQELSALFIISNGIKRKHLI